MIINTILCSFLTKNVVPNYRVSRNWCAIFRKRGLGHQNKSKFPIKVCLNICIVFRLSMSFDSENS